MNQKNKRSQKKYLRNFGSQKKKRQKRGGREEGGGALRGAMFEIFMRHNTSPPFFLFSPLFEWGKRQKKGGGKGQGEELTSNWVWGDPLRTEFTFLVYVARIVILCIRIYEN